MKTHQQGKFITLEGGEGSGKSTLILRLKEFLEQQGYQVTVTREPGGIELAEKVRELIMDNSMDSMTEALLFASARREHLVQRVIPALERGEVVLCDRFVHSSLVYQGIVGGLGVETVSALNQVAVGSYMPDFTLLLDIEPEEGIKRISQNNNREVNRFDKNTMDFHHRIRNGYNSLVDLFPEHHIERIDASGTPEEVFAKGKRVVESYFKTSIGV